MVNPMLKSRWLAAGLHAGLWLLLFLVARELGGNAPRFADLEGGGEPAQSLLPMDRIQTLFAPRAGVRLVADTNGVTPFFTRHFMPPPPSATPLSATRKVELTYQGFYEAGDSPRHAFVKVGDNLFVGPAGARIVANLFIAEISRDWLTLTNAAAQTNTLRFNAKKEFEVPAP